MGMRRATVNFFLKGLLNFVCKIDCSEYKQALHDNKPLIVIFNHINFLEVPILVTHSYPIKVTGLVKSETWKNPVMAFLFNTYNSIPIDRTGAYNESFKQVRKAVDDGYFTCVSPEGKRSKDGVLQKGKAGIIQLAIDANVPILPVAHYGGEHIWQNIQRFKRTPFYFKAGRPFKIRCEGRPGKEEREVILTEVMGQIACLLPENMRGIYAEETQEIKFLEFL
ncbi:MAG: 1-acyl-sn-glycerol-3-phosphate acyltransferase [Treponema sp.]|nr:1-acyl-sn-glycerol-3-phosphate acyltransferase [Treponema sp.]